MPKKFSYVLGLHVVTLAAFSFLLCFIVFLPSCFAAFNTSQDKISEVQIPQFVKDKVDTFVQGWNFQKIKHLNQKISLVLNRYTENKKIYNVLTNLVFYINNSYIYPYEYEVVNVIDGDTIKIKKQGKNSIYSVRMIGIDAPENSAMRFGYVECYGKEAKEYLKKITPQKIYLEADPNQGEHDKYGRALGYVWDVNGNNLNMQMVLNGYAWEYTYDEAYEYQDEFMNAEKEAKENYRGLWNNNACNGERGEKVDVKSIKTSGKENKNSQVSGNFSCETEKNSCKEISTCEEAYFYLNFCSLKSLDGDGDGVPCETIC